MELAELEPSTAAAGGPVVHPQSFTLEPMATPRSF